MNELAENFPMWAWKGSSERVERLGLPRARRR